MTAAEGSYRPTVHWDPTLAKREIRIGDGRSLHPACGQTEQIVVTRTRKMVTCLKCIRPASMHLNLAV